MNAKTKDDGSGTRTQWMRLAEDAVADSGYWKQECRALESRIATLERQVASLLKNLEE
jgi:hypothetical protein